MPHFVANASSAVEGYPQQAAIGDHKSRGPGLARPHPSRESSPDS